MTINELIAEIKDGKMTAKKAAEILGPTSYAAEYYSPAPGEWDTYMAIREAWMAMPRPEQKLLWWQVEQPSEHAQMWEPCPRCGREPIYLPSGLCDQCGGAK